MGSPNTDSGLAVSSRDLSVSIAGLDGVGKTAIVNKLLREEISETYTTYGINQEIVKIDGFRLGLTDLGGKEPFRNSLWQSYISKSDALIYVVDGTKSDTLDESKKWFVRALKWIKKDSPVLVLVNTWDKPIDDGVIKSINKIFLTEVKDHTVDIIPISPITGKNINKTVDWLANAIISNLIAVGITVDYFVAYIKTDDEIVEARIRTPSSSGVDKGIYPVIRYRFANDEESILEYMRIGGRQIVMAADKQTSCWLVTTRSEEFRGTNLLMKLLTEFIREIQGLKEDKGTDISESDLTSHLMKYLIDNQSFWSEKELPMFEISFVENNS
ncbi:MAG: GTP-binding protein [Candidatus Heimdallarchaeota archaeon]|nr:GTP-binding protein [Candidatus Heimdallarchaeota archaeon]